MGDNQALAILYDAQITPILDIMDSDDGDYIRCKFTKFGNACLRQKCFTELQKKVWAWPSYEFFVKKRSNRQAVISAQQADKPYDVYYCASSQRTRMRARPKPSSEAR
ncbi:hypothetical protein N7495_002768 [Penicillium taxi]|uniref:uncharacterized protein n=1 Tax=Penicillium taxi TaxID=168475 RepID=UPI0025459FD7|nr:uncharacterized protein N7495_002768 [Penicillium taxi]KAJ5902240.1 hypothetical protein N7495_002768 [Penicillium taxi]